MKNSSNLEAFKLDKVQMNAIAGGAGRNKVLCQIFDDQGYEDILTAPDGMSRDKAQESLDHAYGGIYNVECHDVHYVV